MCGIAGQVRVDGGRIAPELLQRMCAAIEHRGPDARGEFIADGVALGIQRLRVIDLETGDQPISNEDGTVVVVLNGEIYNYRELRNELESRGHRFATNGDTETIVHLYEEHGEDCVRHLHGMFAFALWDARRRQLSIARDRVGKKPLYYAARRRRLSFASELAGAPRGRDGLARGGSRGHRQLPRLRLRPGSRDAPSERCGSSRPRTRSSGATGVSSSTATGRSTTGRSSPVSRRTRLRERIRSAVRAATRRRMVADVPLGAFLSGGIDSSTVVAAMAEASSSPVKTFSIGFDRQPFDELAHASRIAELFETEHHEFVVRPAAVEVLPRIVRHHGEPFADSSAIPSYYLAEMTRRHVTVALNGDGGDEAFGGYSRYVANSLAAGSTGCRSSFAAHGRPRRQPSDRRGDLSSVQRARRLLGNLALDPAERYARYVQIFDGEQRNALYTDEFSAALAGSDALGPSSLPGRPPLGRRPRHHARGRQRHLSSGDLIAKIDIATMAHALEARSPLLDHEVLELAAALPAELKIRGREKKWILRRAMRGWIPDEILDRPKQGFSVPVSDWLRDELSAWAREVLLDPGTLARGWFRERGVRDMLGRHAAGWDAEAPRIWSLLVLELWQREVVERRAEPVESLLPV